MDGDGECTERGWIEPRRRGCLATTFQRRKEVRDTLDLAEKLKALPQLDEHERLLYARSLLATPDEMWQWNENHLRSLGLFTISERQKPGYSLPE